MLDRRLRKYVTFEQRKKFLRVFKQKFSKKEYVLFLRKFRGSMISKGKRSLSYKFYDYIRIFFKKVLKKNHSNLDPDLIFKKAISKLIPVLGTSNVKRGRIETVPVLLKLRKRIVLMNKWLISSQKNKSNIRGIKIRDVARLIASLLSDKGNVYDQKVENMKRVFSARHILLKMRGRRVNKRAFRRIQNQVLQELKIKHEVPVKSKDERIIDSIGTLFNLIIFLKYKRKFKKVKRIIKILRMSLLRYWRERRHLQERWLLVWDWINIYVSRGKHHKINTRKFDLLKPKYKLVCEDIKKRLKIA